jgi:hypothetical protein
MAKKHVDPLKEKEKKQKILAAVLGVLFIGLLGFQGPKTWKRLHPPAAPVQASASPTAAPPAGTPTLAAPTLQGTGDSSATTGSESLTSSNTTLQEGQLASFSRFASKDPFAQQISEDEKGSSSSSSGGSSGSSGSGSKTATPVASGSKPAPGSAVISVNGTLYAVAVGTDFPQASATDASVVPLFHLVSLTAHTAKISIVGGSYSNGSPAVTLTENKPVTLMNTADGTRYKLILKPAGTDVQAPSTPAATTSTTVTIPPATP